MHCFPVAQVRMSSIDMPHLPWRVEAEAKAGQHGYTPGSLEPYRVVNGALTGFPEL